MHGRRPRRRWNEWRRLASLPVTKLRWCTSGPRTRVCGCCRCLWWEKGTERYSLPVSLQERAFGHLQCRDERDVVRHRAAPSSGRGERGFFPVVKRWVLRSARHG